MNRGWLAVLLLIFCGIPSGGQVQKVDGIIETEADRKPRTVTHGDCLIKGGTIFTVTHGEIPNGSILIRGGKITAIGLNVPAPPGVPVIDARGKYVMPGIVDAHSHISEQETNEGTDSVTPEVRIRDVLDPNAISIYAKLASGFTTSLVLHGSSNAIGGESVVIKHKYRRPVEELPVPDAPRVVKFALGENVKSSFDPFGGGSGRFPRSRMGVEAVYRRAFSEARRYMEAWDLYNKSGREDSKKPPPRRDIRLEALSDILRRNIWIHCHCYRADEMLMMLRLSKEFGFKLAALQHALEAYKITPEIAAAGVGVSTFADDWGYKVEAFDAIPHNAALCVRAGIVTSVNTDTGGSLSLLNVDAAKCMKYGGLTEDEALRLITINPAIQLGIERHAGSLEVGKDGDISIWAGHPLSALSHCVMTLVEGTVYFERRDSFGLDSQMELGPPPPSFQTARTALSINSASPAYALIGATVHPVLGADIPNGVVILRGGKIEAVGAHLAIPRDAQRLSLKGMHVYPGLIDAGSLLGLKEIEQVGATVDTAEGGLFHPDLLALTAVNPASEHIVVARTEGVTTTFVRAEGAGFLGDGPLINGIGAVVDLNGWTGEQMAVRSRGCLTVYWPEGPAALPDFVQSLFPADELKRQRDVAKDRVRQLREYFELAQRYAATKIESPARAANDPRLDAIIPYATGKTSVIVNANTVSGIKQAVDFAQKLGLKLIIGGGEQAWRLADMLAAKSIPVICSLHVVETVENGPIAADFDPYDAPFSNPALLHRAGVKICFQTSNAALAKNLKICAATAAAYGLPKEAALKALTSDSADILGIGAETGSITAGKRANIIVTDGDPLEVTTNLHALFIDGKPVALVNRHTQLYDRYKARR